VTQHLSSRQISEWIAGERTAAGERHVQECMECSAQIEAATGQFRLFRDAMQAAVADSRLVTLPVPRRTPWFRAHRLSMAAVTCALLLLAAIPLYRWRETPAPAVHATPSDDALLRSVRNSLSQSAPSPLEPLADLMPASEESASTRSAQ